MTLTVLTVIVCLGFPFMSKGIVVPFLSDTFGTVETMALSENNMIIMVIMVAVLILLFAFLFGRTTKRIVPLYMAGVNTGDDLSFIDSMQGKTQVSLRNWYGRIFRRVQDECHRRGGHRHCSGDRHWNGSRCYAGRYVK